MSIGCSEAGRTHLITTKHRCHTKTTGHLLILSVGTTPYSPCSVEKILRPWLAKIPTYRSTRLAPPPSDRP